MYACGCLYLQQHIHVHIHVFSPGGASPAEATRVALLTAATLIPSDTESRAASRRQYVTIKIIGPVGPETRPGASLCPTQGRRRRGKVGGHRPATWGRC